MGMGESETPAIHITDGPYVIEGEVPVVRTSQVETDHGEPVAWAPDEAIESGATVMLCRCGRSADKPFCDGSHKRGEPFDGTETADRGPSADRRKSYAGVGMVLTDDRSLCEHAGFCGNRYNNAWRMTRETDDPAVREHLISMVKLCPSGALEYALEEGDPPIEPELPTSVAVVRDGPLWVRGGVRIAGADGVEYETRNRVTLCRCGQSTNKPYCDGTHAEIGFTDPRG
jgi:CDGSH-type Zn-finger protein